MPNCVFCKQIALPMTHKTQLGTKYVFGVCVIFFLSFGLTCTENLTLSIPVCQFFAQCLLVFPAFQKYKNFRMAETLQNNKVALRACILYEVLSRQPIYNCYTNFCNRIGDDVIGYREFEFWFYRFYQGNHELDSERR